MVTTGPGGLPPHDTTVEEAVIAALLLADDAIAHVVPIVEPADFFRDEHRWAYEAALALYNRNEAITIPTLAHELARAGHLEEMGGEAALFEVAGQHFSATGVEAHARIVARDARYRALIQTAGQIAQLAYEGGPDAGRVLAAAMALVGGLVQQRDVGVERLGDLPMGEEAGMLWGIPALDRYTMGLAPGQLSIVAGRTASGKSMLAAQVARNCAAAGGKALIFTMEMSSGEYQRRMAHAIAGVHKRYSNYGDPYSPLEQAHLDEALDKIGGWHVYSSARSGVTVPVIAAAARLSEAELHIDLIVVDYLQLMGLTDDRASEASNLKQITASLKELAVEIGCHVLLISQMNRAAHSEMRGKQGGQLKCIITESPYPEPFVEGLMGGAVENDADLVVMLQRHSNCPTLNHMEICIVKNRNGTPGHGLMIDNYALCRFESLSEKECFAIAAGNLDLSRRLRIDQCLMREDWKAREAAATWADEPVSWARDEALARGQ